MIGFLNFADLIANELEHINTPGHVENGPKDKITWTSNLPTSPLGHLHNFLFLVRPNGKASL